MAETHFRGHVVQDSPSARHGLTGHIKLVVKRQRRTCHKHVTTGDVRPAPLYRQVLYRDTRHPFTGGSYTGTLGTPLQAGLIPGHYAPLYRQVCRR
uniref:Uncharacterized protein n=1 Tax=Timema cristinae TaxID=61476 RepID=A0A7R9DAA2_TIMCR|nr:unnamed protein product [Timema cristinae]